ncbi:MAG: serine/threonine protein kinase, partial [Microcoleus sp. T3-bin5]|nr:serine/threonine protein kinase [Microcoleus sp. T3-bin5]
FDLAWRYNSTSLNSNRSKIESFQSLEDLLKSRDLSGPMFGQPSVESSPIDPIELNKRPKPPLDSSNIPEQIDPSETSAEPSGFPSPETAAPDPEAEPEPSPRPELQEQPSESPISEPQTEIEPAPEPELAPVPEVAPLPAEPPLTPAPPTPKSAETLPPSESAPPVIASPIEGSPEPAIPSRSDSNSDSSIAPDSPPPVAEPTVPFPEPATN